MAEHIGAVASAAALVQLAWNALTSLGRLISEYRAHESKLQSLQDDLESFHANAQTLSRVICSKNISSDRDLERALHDYKITILAFEQRLKAVYNSSQNKHFRKARQVVAMLSEDKDIIALRRKINRHIRDMSIRMGALLYERSNALESKMHKGFKKQRKQSLEDLRDLRQQIRNDSREDLSLIHDRLDGLYVSTPDDPNTRPLATGRSRNPPPRRTPSSAVSRDIPHQRSASGPPQIEPPPSPPPSSHSSDLSSTRPTWGVSVRVLAVVSALTFSAGYAVSKGSGRAEQKKPSSFDGGTTTAEKLKNNLSGVGRGGKMRSEAVRDTIGKGAVRM